MIPTAVLLLLLQAPPPPQAPEWKPPSPDKRPKAVTLGLLGARGESHPAQRTITVDQVFHGGPALAGGLQVDDVIVVVGGARLSATLDPVYALIDKIEEVTVAKPGSRPPVLAVTVQRGAKTVRLEVPFPALGPHARDCGGTCDRCAGLTKQSLDWLAQQQIADGSFDLQWDDWAKKVSTCSVGALAFLASGSTPEAGPYARNLLRARDYLIESVGRAYVFPANETRANYNMVNWPLGYGGIFLALCHLRAPDAESQVKLQYIVDRLVQNQETSGGWAHGPGGVNADGYTELQVVGNLCLTALGLARQVGCTVPQASIDKGLAYLGRCTTATGGVNYNADPDQSRGPGEAGRTAGALVAYQALGMTGHANYRPSLDYYTQRIAILHGGHGGIATQFLWGAMASHAQGAEAWKTYRKGMRHELLAARQPDGTFGYRPSTQNDDPKQVQDKLMGPIWTTAHHLIIEQLPLGHLRWAPK